ncbi:MAG: hypothetical protein LBT59_12715 [Clostridiales bacterium]|jgi:hypothetical protein|nr:hypothetical protein [Clostridiales bacterium]
MTVKLYFKTRDPENRSKILPLKELATIHQKIDLANQFEGTHWLGKYEVQAMVALNAELPNYLMSDAAGKAPDFSDHLKASGRLDYASAQSALLWHVNNKLLTPVHRAINANLDTLVRDSQYYYTDVGMPAYKFMSYPPSPGASIFLLKNFAFLELSNRDQEVQICHFTPTLGSDKKVVFLASSFKTKCVYAIGVSAGSQSSADKLLSDGFADFSMHASSKTYGSLGPPGVLTIPIYLLGRFDFNQMVNPALKASFSRENATRAEEEFEEEGDGELFPPFF